MGLTSPAFVVLMLCAAGAALAGVTAAWPWAARPRAGSRRAIRQSAIRERAGGQRASGRRSIRERAGGQRASGRRPGAGLAARLGLLAGSQVVVIAAFLACLNAYFGFFGSWAELLGTSQPAVIAAARPQAARPGPAGSAATGLGARGSGARGVSRSAGRLTISASQPGPLAGERLLANLQPAPDQQGIGPASIGQGSASNGSASNGSASNGSASNGSASNGSASPGGRASDRPSVTGRLLQVAMTGPRTGISVSGDYVYLPPQYFQPAYARARFPVILALTGYPGSAKSLVMRLNLPSAAAAATGVRRMPPAVLVMMNASPVMPRDTECTDVPAGPQVQTFFARDVPSLMQARFRVQAGPAGWAVLGYSTGGYCAIKLAMLNPYQFGSAVSLAGYYTALRDGTTGNLYGGSLGYRHENDPGWRLRHLPAPPVSVLATSSRVGEETYPGTLAFLRLVRPPMRAYALFLAQGGHNFRTWQRELPQSLAWLGHRLSPPR